MGMSLTKALRFLLVRTMSSGAICSGRQEPQRGDSEAVAAPDERDALAERGRRRIGETLLEGDEALCNASAAGRQRRPGHEWRAARGA